MNKTTKPDPEEFLVLMLSYNYIEAFTPVEIPTKNEYRSLNFPKQHLIIHRPKLISEVLLSLLSNDSVLAECLL